MSDSGGQSVHPSEPHGKDPEFFRRVESAFFEVAMLAPVDREDALDRLCAGDSVMETEVRSLLASAEKVGAFLGQPALGRDAEQLARDSAAGEPVDDLIGANLGSFRVVRRIASGGMGSVYLGERSDGQFDLKVAIKVVKRGMDSEEILNRFRAERQTLAALDHPNIARLIDGGMTPDGRPFLVMEYVDGLPIDRYCDQKRLNVRDRIALFRQVCEGVHHAHQNLVIHRDIKPSNILVSPQGIPKLLDFGIAKVLTGGTTDQDVTAETDRRLTPEYASPEQVEARSVSTATDVYSLGVVLYELLTGARPYYLSVRTSEELRRVVCGTMPPVPSNAVALSASRAGMKSVPVSDQARASAPSSKPPSSLLPTGAETATTNTAADIPMTRGMSSTRLRSVLRGDLDTIVMLALRKEPLRRYASAEQFSADLGRYLDGMPVQARPDTLSYRASKFIRRHAVAVGMATAAAVLLSTATVMLYRQSRQLTLQRDELIAGNRSLEETRRYLTTILGGGDTGNLGPDAKLGAVLDEATRALRDSPPADPLTRASSQQALGRALMSLGVLPEARDLLESAARGFASMPPESTARCDVEVALAELLFFEGKYVDAEKSFRDLLNDERSRAGVGHTEREGLLLNDLGASLRLQSKADDAIVAQHEALVARIAVHGEKSLPVAETRNNLGSALFQKGDLAGAIEQLQRSLQTRQALLRPDHPLVIRCMSNLGLAQLKQGEVERAAVTLQQSAESWDRAFGPEHPGRVPTITSLAQALRRLGKCDEALTWLHKAIDWQTPRLPSGSPAIAATEANIAITMSECHRGDEARAILERVVPILRGAGPGFTGIAAAAEECLAKLHLSAEQLPASK